MTLIAVYNSSGCVGRCDARCYEASHSDCDCICRGRNHGAGLKQATNNTRELCEEWIEAYEKIEGEKFAAWEVLGNAPQQQFLF